MEQNTSISLLEKIQEWISSSITLKLLVIGIITLILLSPQSLTLDLIQERQNRLEEAEQEVTGKWSRSQTVIGPYLSIPYHYYREVQAAGESKLVKEIKTAYFLPDVLDIRGTLHTESLHRGIFDVVVYTGDLQFKADFKTLPIEKIGLTPDQIIWDQASL